jgi:hypothetical protein
VPLAHTGTAALLSTTIESLNTMQVQRVPLPSRIKVDPTSFLLWVEPVLSQILALPSSTEILGNKIAAHTPTILK